MLLPELGARFDTMRAGDLARLATVPDVAVCQASLASQLAPRRRPDPRRRRWFAYEAFSQARTSDGWLRAALSCF